MTLRFHELRRWRAMSVVALALSLFACGTIKSWFPDKQKEYRYSSEIPPLEIPPDVLGEASPVAGMAAANPPPRPSATHAAAEDAAAAALSGGKPAPARRDAIEDSPIGKYKPAPEGAEATARLAQDSNGPHVVVEAPFASVWTFTEKALNRLHVEIKDKDRSKQVFYVYYSQNAAPYEDKGMWHDLTGIFRKEKPKESEREYQVQLESSGNVLTKIRIADAAGQAQSEGESQVLLKALREKLATLSQPSPEESKEENQAPENAR